MEHAKQPLIVYGDSDYAQMLAGYFERDGGYTVAAYCVDRAYKRRETVGDIPVVAYEEVTDVLPVDRYHIFAAIGYKSVRLHRDLYRKVASLGYPVARYVSPQAFVDPSASIGENCMVLPGAIVEPYVRIEANCFVNSGAIVTHHARIEAHTIVAAGALIGGHSEVGEASLVGFHATVGELVVLGEETLVAAGSVLLESTQPHTMYAGAPAKAIRTHRQTGIVLSDQKR